MPGKILTTDTHVYFYSGHPFSQGHVARFKSGDCFYYSVEQYMIAKASLFEDWHTRQVKPFNATDWAIHAPGVVRQGNYLKFSQNRELAAILLDTGDRVLVEASPFDRTWGVGLAVDDPKILDSSLWRGQNLLGMALMLVRDELRAPLA